MFLSAPLLKVHCYHHEYRLTRCGSKQHFSQSQFLHGVDDTKRYLKDSGLSNDLKLVWNFRP